MRDLVLLSGGLDSSTLLAARVALADANDAPRPLAVVVDYGQRHAREVGAAYEVGGRYGVIVVTLDLRPWGATLTGSALTDRSVPVPHGHYADASMAATIVPNRNATMLCAAAGIAAARGCEVVLTAVHAGDHPVYPDCRPEFIDAIDRAVQLGTGGLVRIAAPFVNISKTDIARQAGDLGVPIGATWSCYEGGRVHCGRCGTCVERIEALRDAGVPDPTEYASAAA